MVSEDTAETVAHESANGLAYERRWWILAVLCLSLVIVVMGNTLLNVAIPTLVRDLGATNTGLQWIVDAYALVFGGLLLTMGALGDRFGRKGALQIGLVIFAVASVGATLGTAQAHLIVARAVQGLGAALVMPATLSILTNVFPPNERGKAIGVWAAFAGVGGAIGPVLGGWLLEHFWWGAVFLVNVPVIIVALVAGVFLVPTSRDPFQTRLDPVGAVLSIVALGGLLVAIIQGPDNGWSSPLVLAGFALAVVGTAAFVWWELRVEHPMLEIRLFGDRGFATGTTSIAFAFFAMFGTFFLLTQYLQFVLDYSPLEAGIRTLPLAAGLMVAAPNSDRLARRLGANYTVGAGLVVVAVGLVGLAVVTVDSPFWIVGVTLLFLGIGMGAAMAPSTGAIMAAMPLAKAGVGSAVNDTSREVGGAIGVAVLGSILSAGYRSNVQGAIPPQVPEHVADLVTESLGSAELAASQIGGDTATAITQGANNAFVDAQGTSYLVGAAMALIAAFVAARFMPRYSQGESLDAASPPTHAETEP